MHRSDLPAPRRPRFPITGLPASIRAVLRPEAAVPHPAEAPQRALRVASYNVHKCIGTDGRFDPDRIREVIREIDADIIALQEVDRRFGTRDGLLNLPELEARTGLVPVPVSGIRNADGWHGNLLLVRSGLVQNVEQIALPGLEPRGAIVTDLQFDDHGPLRVIAAHFGLLRQSRARQVARLSSYLQASADMPALLMGDLNEWRSDHGSVLHGLHAQISTLPPAVASFPASRPRLPLDRIIPFGPGVLSPVSAHDSDLAKVASDHLPIKAWLSFQD
ncbi:endonuclease/exonuclease/phosphatase family protein [Falsigemmobacter intermedius]|uniref:endonuclease/exonuclease/phosphatase family protein n=1 Tax=Falsigemmobacter intermedius TaxID=1553448 RepID=UPI003F101D8D